jgi:hypothetical protein
VVPLKVIDAPTLTLPSVCANTEGAAKTNAEAITIDNRNVRHLPGCVTARKTAPNDDPTCTSTVGRVLSSSMLRNRAVRPPSTVVDDKTLPFDETEAWLSTPLLWR